MSLAAAANASSESNHAEPYTKFHDRTFNAWGVPIAKHEYSIITLAFGKKDPAEITLEIEYGIKESGNPLTLASCTYHIASSAITSMKSGTYKIAIPASTKATDELEKEIADRAYAEALKAKIHVEMQGQPAIDFSAPETIDKREPIDHEAAEAEYKRVYAETYADIRKRIQDHPIYPCALKEGGALFLSDKKLPLHKGLLLSFANGMTTYPLPEIGGWIAMNELFDPNHFGPVE